MTATSEETVSGATAGGTATEAGAAYRSAGAEATSDIGQAEAWIANVKQMFDDYGAHQAALRRIQLQDAQNAADHANRLRVMAEQGVSALVSQTQVNMREGSENSRFGFDQMYPSASNVVADALAVKLAQDVASDDEKK